MEISAYDPSLPNDHLDLYDLNIDINDEIEEFSRHRNMYEDDLVFSKKGVIDAIDK
jgi:hypothetical protein